MRHYYTWGILLGCLLAEQSLLASSNLFDFTVAPKGGWSLFSQFSAPVPINAQPTSQGAQFNGFQMGFTGAVLLNKTWFLGLDFGYIPALNFSYFDSSKNTISSLNNLTDTTAIKFGFIAGFRLKETPWRFWTGINLEDDLVFDIDYPNENAVQIAVKGVSLKAGIGYLFSEHFAVEIEASHTFYNAIESDYITSSALTDQSVSLKNVASSCLTLMISIPFDINMDSETAPVTP